ALICRDRDSGSDGTLDQRHYALQDANYRVRAIVDAAGSVAERYAFAPYGERTVLNADWSADADGISDVAFAFGHQGLRHDAVTGLVYNRARMLHPKLGRFVQRDPLGYVDGMNVYQYLLSSPVDLLDRFGLWGHGKRYYRNKIRDLIRNAPIDRTQSPIIQNAQYQEFQRKLRNLQQELENHTSGHSDFPGGDVFDYTKEDLDPATRPWPLPNPGVGRHFRPLGPVQQDLNQAIAECNKDRFERLMHQGQDYFSHYGRGYTDGFNMGGGGLNNGHIGFGDVDPDNADKWPQFYDGARKWTQKNLDRWHANCCLNQDGEWVPK
ncbi:MAG: RHS repeat domain-containing protein, partial [Phycisphaeraceae bacterium]